MNIGIATVCCCCCCLMYSKTTALCWLMVRFMFERRHHKYQPLMQSSFNEGVMNLIREGYDRFQRGFFCCCFFLANRWRGGRLPEYGERFRASIKIRPLFHSVQPPVRHLAYIPHLIRFSFVFNIKNILVLKILVITETTKEDRNPSVQ